LTSLRDLSGRTVVVTGATSGMGLVMSRELVESGARLIGIGRHPARVEALRAELRRIGRAAEPVVLAADLSTRRGILKATAEVRAQARSIEVLINNAGAHFSRRRLSVDGLEMHIAVDYLPAYAFMSLLEAELISGRAHIINVVSDALRDARQLPMVGRPRPPRVDVADLADLHSLNPEAGYRAFEAYARAKLLTASAGLWFARRWASAGIAVMAVHPGIVATGIVDDLIPRWLRPFRSAIRSGMLTPERGAAAALRLVTLPAAAGLDGRYFVREREAELPLSARDPEVQEILIEASYRFLMTG
jgi:NAD(P)-dependent dehydrogenase (short-subunit alcohol dehydrogenase family)